MATLRHFTPVVEMMTGPKTLAPTIAAQLGLKSPPPTPNFDGIFHGPL
jgi:hypothetical protein